MGQVKYVRLTGEIHLFEKEIDEFLSRLNAEKQYIHLTFSRFLKSKYLWVVMDEGKILGTCGLVRRGFFFLFPFIVLLCPYQGKGIGSELKKKVFNELRTGWHVRVIIAAVQKENLASLKHNLSLGAKLLGERKNTIYFVGWPEGNIGSFSLLFLKLGFFSIKQIELFLAFFTKR